MSFQKKNIKDIVNGIQENKFLLPVIQRGVVWSNELIENLFESIFLNYPIGSFLFWQYNIENKENYLFYEFLKEMNEFKQEQNKVFDLNGLIGKTITAVLDGQQRLTSLYIGLKSSINIHKPRTVLGEAKNFVEKKLYINILNSGGNDVEEECDDNVIIYKNTKSYFSFKTEEEVEKENNKKEHLWFKIGDILDFKDMFGYKQYISNYKEYEENKQELILNNFIKLFNIFNKEEIINFYEVKDKDFDEVLDIFIRVNSGGTKLSKADFLMSVISSNWIEAKNEINKTINAIKNNYNFCISQDILLKGFLLLNGENIRINVNNFKNETINNIKNDYGSLIKYINLSCEIFKNLGFNYNNLKSSIIIMVLASFLKENNLNKFSEVEKNYKNNIKKWIYLTILSGVLSYRQTAYLEDIRKIFKEHKNEFALDKIKKLSKEKNYINIDIDEEILSSIIDKAEKGSQNSWILLTILYQNNNFQYVNFHEDHIYPFSKLSSEESKNGGNYIANLQLLEGIDNISKNDKTPQDWVLEYVDKKNISLERYKKDNFIPLDLELTSENFDDFIIKRKEIIKNKIFEKIKDF